MNLKYKVLGAVAALGLSLGLGATALALPADVTNTAPVTVTLTDTGTFAVSIVGATLTGVNVSASAGATSTGSFCVRYDDSKTYREQFHTKLLASDFTSNTLRVPASRVNAGQPYKISASTFEITRNFDVF